VAGQRKANEDLAVAAGLAVVLLGVALMFGQFVSLRIIASSWPLLVIAPGVILLVAAMALPRGHGLAYLAVPAAMVISTGAVLQVQTITGDWASWTYVWPLIAPGSVGAGLLIGGWRERHPGSRRSGRTLIVTGGVLFLAAELFFARILGIGGPGGAWSAELALGTVALIVGVKLIARGLRHAR